MATNHTQTRIKVGDMEADVDHGIAPLIMEIWKAGIATVMSCEENQPGIIWIQFLEVEDAVTFLNIVAPYEETWESIYNRARLGWEPSDKKLLLPFWTYDVSPEDLSLQEECNDNGDVTGESHCGQPCFVFSLSIRFPQEDYALVLNRITEHNRSGTEGIV